MERKSLLVRTTTWLTLALALGLGCSKNGDEDDTAPAGPSAGEGGAEGGDSGAGGARPSTGGTGGVGGGTSGGTSSSGGAAGAPETSSGGAAGAPVTSTGGAAGNGTGGQTPDPEPGARVIGHDDTDLSAIPAAAITAARQTLHVAYEHTSHGSQLITGMSSLASFPDYGARYAWSDSGDGEALDLDDDGIPADVDDLSQGDSEDSNGDTPWVVGTRALLDDPANAHVNVVMWSWCSINGHDAQRYVDNMEKLIREYPSVTFVFMTGHAEGAGEDLTENGVHYNNQLIREHCRANDRWLFDFADIEAYDPDGTYFWDAGLYDNLDYDSGNWAVEWIAGNPEHDLALLTLGVDGFAGTSGCAHSDSPVEGNLNCVLKGAAAWHLFARLAGWDGVTE